MTNPPVPATPLDVEACVRLLEDAARYEEGFVARYGSEVMCDEELRNATLFRALASALPGMGKALDLVRDCPRCQGYLRSGRLTLAQSEREAQSVLDRLSAARAAQPEETSADEV